MNSYATIIPRGRKVHQYYKDHNQTWNPYEQIAHIHAEVSELWEVLRNKDQRYGTTFFNEWNDKLLDEMSDVIVSALTIALDLNFSENDIEKAMERTLRKIEARTWAKEMVEKLTTSDAKREDRVT